MKRRRRFYFARINCRLSETRNYQINCRKYFRFGIELLNDVIEHYPCLDATVETEADEAGERRREIYAFDRC